MDVHWCLACSKQILTAPVQEVYCSEACNSLDEHRPLPSSIAFPSPSPSQPFASPSPSSSYLATPSLEFALLPRTANGRRTSAPRAYTQPYGGGVASSMKSGREGIESWAKSVTTPKRIVKPTISDLQTPLPMGGFLRLELGPARPQSPRTTSLPIISTQESLNLSRKPSLAGLRGAPSPSLTSDDLPSPSTLTHNSPRLSTLYQSPPSEVRSLHQASGYSPLPPSHQHRPLPPGYISPAVASISMSASTSSGSFNVASLLTTEETSSTLDIEEEDDPSVYIVDDDDASEEAIAQIIHSTPQISPPLLTSPTATPDSQAKPASTGIIGRVIRFLSISGASGLPSASDASATDSQASSGDNKDTTVLSSPPRLQPISLPAISPSAITSPPSHHHVTQHPITSYTPPPSNKMPIRTTPMPISSPPRRSSWEFEFSHSGGESFGASPCQCAECQDEEGAVGEEGVDFGRESSLPAEEDRRRGRSQERVKR